MLWVGFEERIPSGGKLGRHFQFNSIFELDPFPHRRQLFVSA